MSHRLRAGAAAAEVMPDQDCFPVDGFTGVHDPLHVRVLILESDIKIVIVSAEITTLPDETLRLFREAVCERTGAEEKHVWITTTHSFAGPHIWPSPRPGEADISRPGHPPRAPEEIARCGRLEEAYLSALRAAAAAAQSGLREAVAGSGKGACTVNISRNMPTPEGWWTGADSEEFCDHSLTVLRVDGTDGTAIAALFVYGVRSCVVNRVKQENGEQLISSDLCGAACAALEKEFGGGFTALFLCGPAGDQEPQLKGCYDELDRFGALRHVELPPAAAFALLDAQGARLAAEVRKVWRGIAATEDIPALKAGRGEYVCRTKKMDRDMRSLRPRKNCEFEPEGEKRLSVCALGIGELYLAGVQPEIDGITARAVAGEFPDKNAAVAIMVNGGGKCMPEEESYALCKFQSQNSPFMPGSAEIMRDAAVKLLKRLEAE